MKTCRWGHAWSYSSTKPANGAVRATSGMENRFRMMRIVGSIGAADAGKGDKRELQGYNTLVEYFKSKE